MRSCSLVHRGALALRVGVLVSIAAAGCSRREPARIADTSQAAASSTQPAAGASSAPSALLIVAAVDYEYAAAVKAIGGGESTTLDGRQITAGRIGDKPVVVIRAGWGKAQAAGATAAAIDRYHAAVVVMAGVGGGLDDASVTSGDVVIVRRSFQYDLGKLTAGALEIWAPETPQELPYPNDDFQSEPRLVDAAWKAAKAAHFERWALPRKCSCEKDGTRKTSCVGDAVPIGRESPRICAGTIGTGDAFVVDPALAARLTAKRSVVLVDMETAAVAEEAANHGLPFVGIRVVGDTVNGDNEDLYYCLKPMAGPRLSEVLANVLPALANVRADVANDDGAPIECQASAFVGLGPATTPHVAPELTKGRHALRVR